MKCFKLLLTFLIVYNAASGQNTNNLPDVLTFVNGKKITTQKEWINRREEILEIMTTEMYGVMPGKPKNIRFEIFDNDTNALRGKATRRQVTLHLKENDKETKFDLLIYIPNKAKQPVPAFVAINFFGNQSVNADPGIKITEAWVEENKNFPCSTNGKATEACRGMNADSWPLDSILDAGYALVTFYKEEIAADSKEKMFTVGVHPLYPELQNREDNFGTIGAWAWAMSRAVDYLETDQRIDKKKIIAFGFSRLGKAALWAAATDQRFAAVISNDSGAGGGKQFRRGIGEDINRLCNVFPQWYDKNFRKYINKDTVLPFDQHFVLALIAPRPVYLGTAREDKNADPEGEFETAKASDAVYRFLGTKGFPYKNFPPLSEPLFGQIGFHIRPGGHALTSYDWSQYLKFSEIYFSK